MEAELSAIAAPLREPFLSRGAGGRRWWARRRYCLAGSDAMRQRALRMLDTRINHDRPDQIEEQIRMRGRNVRHLMNDERGNFGHPCARGHTSFVPIMREQLHK